MNRFQIFLNVLIIFFFSCSHPTPEQMKTTSLNSAWKFCRAGDSIFLEATVPGTVHTDLLANGKIPDPFIGFNEDSVQWIEKEDWIYTKTFTLTGKELEYQYHELIFEGLDTYADVFLNGKSIIQADNMFVSWQKECSELLLEGENELKILFYSPVKKGLEKASKLDYLLMATNEQATDELKANVFTRKAPFHFGWDWGPRLVTSGIWRPVSLVSWNHAIINDVHLIQDIFSHEKCRYIANVEIRVETEGRYNIVVSEPSIGLLAEVSRKMTKGLNNISLELNFENPMLWWTNGLGDAHLYSLNIALVMNKKIIHSIDRNLGIRKLRLIQDKDEKGRSFYFELNDRPVFMKGANYIPGDIFTPRVSEEKYLRVIDEALKANMNMLRVWGGGIYENDIFYDLCDKNGILVWQDFMFACAMQPGDTGHLNNIRKEAEYNIKRLRNHPSLALWCGNNENLVAWNNWGWQDQYTKKQNEFHWQTYKNIFYKILPQAVNTFDPDRTYWPSSPQSYGDKLPDRTSGDEHDWTVWFGQKNFDAYGENVPRFVSEYGLQSFPCIETLRSFAKDSDLEIFSPILDHRQRSNMNWIQAGFNGNNMIIWYLEKYFPSPRNIDQLIYLSQLSQQLSMKEAIEAHRRNMPWCMGSLFWQINDCWPTISWASVDYFGNWKASHYQAKRSFENLILAEELDGNTLSIMTVSDLEQDKTLSLQLHWINNSGSFTGKSSTNEIVAKSNSSTLVHQEILTDDDINNLKNITLVARLFEKNNLLNEKLISFVIPKDQRLFPSTIQATISRRTAAYIIDLETTVPAKYVELSFPGYNGWFDDNYFHISPDNPKRIHFHTTEIIENPEKSLRIKTLNNLR